MRLFAVLLLILPLLAQAQDPDRRAVYNASLDYIEGMYTADPARIQKSTFKDLVKRGFYWKGKSQTFSELTSMSYDQLVQVAKDWNREGWLPEDAPREITILDIQDKIALVKTTAYWGIDYLHLCKMDDKWMIVNVIWQNFPKGKPVESQTGNQ